MDQPELKEASKKCDISQMDWVFKRSLWFDPYSKEGAGGRKFK